MTSSFNIGGLVSGIDTNSVIAQLMQVAAAPQNQLKTQLATVQSKDAAYQDINAKLAAVKTAADALAKADTWAATTATSSDSSVVATGSSTAVPGSITSFQVTQIAQAQVSTTAVADPANAATGNSIAISIHGGPASGLTLADNSAASVVSAVNGANLGVRAALIDLGNGQQVLQFTGTSTGARSDFAITGLTGTLSNLTDAQDASITVGDPAAGGYTVTSATNTFTGAIPGITFTVSKPTSSPVTISVASNPDSIAKAVQSLVDAVNTALTTMTADTAQGGVLASDSTVTGIAQRLLGVVSAGTTTGQSYLAGGLDITSDGKLTFDADAFAAAYASDPASMQTMVAGGFAAALSDVADQATDSGTGSLTQLVASDKTQENSLSDQISTWDTRLADQQQMLQAKFTAMETALAKLKSQSSYLTQMFASMNGSSSSSTSSSSGS